MRFRNARVLVHHVPRRGRMEINKSISCNDPRRSRSSRTQHPFPRFLFIFILFRTPEPAQSYVIPAFVRLRCRPSFASLRRWRELRCTLVDRSAWDVRVAPTYRKPRAHVKHSVRVGRVSVKPGDVAALIVSTPWPRFLGGEMWRNQAKRACAHSKKTFTNDVIDRSEKLSLRR